MQTSLACVVLCAGASSRMKSSVPKVFHDLSGRSVLGHVMHNLKAIRPHHTIIVASPQTASHEDYGDATVVIQENPQGTAFAVQTALPLLQDMPVEDVMIVCGDMPLLLPETLEKLKNSSTMFTVLCAQLPLHEKSAPYGRLFFDSTTNAPLKIVEYKEATALEKENLWFNVGVYKINKALLKNLLQKITNHNQTGEYYLTDLLQLCVQEGYTTKAIVVDYEESVGVNSRDDLAKANAFIQNRLRSQFLKQGVTLIDPHTIHFSADTVIEQDVVIEPYVMIGPVVQIETGVRVKSFSYLSHCHLHKDVCVGPFAHLRENVTLHEGCVVGNFVEIKNTILHKTVKAKHLTYLADATVGEKTNIGAGVITANYDGFFKHQTHIGEGVSIGANTVLIAPVSLQKSAMTAAGSVITRDVKEGDLAISRGRQDNKTGWAHYYREKMRLKKTKLT